MSEEVRENMRKNHWSKKEGYIPPMKGKIGELNPLFGRKRPREMVEKINEKNTKKLDLDYIKYSYLQEKKLVKRQGKRWEYQI